MVGVWRVGEGFGGGRRGERVYVAGVLGGGDEKGDEKGDFGEGDGAGCARDGAPLSEGRESQRGKGSRRVERTNLDDLGNTFRERDCDELEEVILEGRSLGVGAHVASEDGVGVDLVEERVAPDVEGNGRWAEHRSSSELRKEAGG